MENGWIKYFIDNTKEYGFDSLVNKKEASWSKGRLDNIEKVSLTHNNKTLRISGLGNFWQSDDFEVPIWAPTPIVVKRRIQKKINNYDRFLLWIDDSISSTYLLVSSLPNPTPPGYNISLITEDLHNKWLTLELDIKTKLVNVKFLGNKV